MRRWVKRYMRERGVDPVSLREVYTSMGMTDANYEAALQAILAGHVSVTASGTNVA